MDRIPRHARSTGVTPYIALHVQRWLFIRSPIRSLRSSTVTSHPSSASLDAAETPAIPAPITIAFFAFGIVFARTMHYD